jgi:hypothetical protein
VCDVKAGELVVLVNDVQGIGAGQEGRVMSVRKDAVLVECRLQEQLHVVLTRTWDLLPQPIYRRLLKRHGILSPKLPGYAGHDLRSSSYGASRNEKRRAGLRPVR